jgi:hypothetical protein
MIAKPTNIGLMKTNDLIVPGDVVGQVLVRNRGAILCG